ncbi:DUF551 domain-containing protein [Acinetobacter indicus]|nr:DUF551 domain-containing protein [Acinetobacter indicus]
MDIQEDKDFAALPEVAKLYQACKERDLTIAEREYLKGARDAWQAKAQAVPEWISVEDELPPTDTMVLICWFDSPDIEPEKDFMDICTDTGCPFWANYLNDMPTHWMHLPVVAQGPAND